METITEKLNSSRQELLDLSLRNTLLNYRLLKSRGVAIVDEIPQEIYRILVMDGKTMSFLPQTDGDESTSDDLIDEDVESVDSDLEPTKRHLDKYLQTKHTENELQKRLLNSYYASRTYLEEQGVNILYLALGMLEWYEDDNSDILRQAPLVLVPVNLQRTNVKTPFRLTYTQEDIGENLSLSAKMEQDFGIEFTSLATSEELTLSAYFQAISDSIREQSRWRVNEKAIALGFFSFGTFLMYKAASENKTRIYQVK